MNRHPVLDPVRDLATPSAPYAVRVRDDWTGAEIAFVGWYPSLSQAMADARYEFPNAVELEPEWLELPTGDQREAAMG